jgi:hypothetical protein
MKKGSTSLAIKEMQIKMTQIPSHPNKSGYHQEKPTKKAGEYAGKKELYALLVGM